MNETPPLPYRCPGESQPISKSIHLGRLARFDPACRTCPHRHDVATLAPRQQEQLLQVQQRVPRSTLFTDEGIAGTVVNDVQPSDARRIAAAAGVFLRRRIRAQLEFPTVVIGSDGRGLTAEMLAAVSEGLRYAGCKVVDIGYTTAPCVSFSIDHLNAAGGVFVGNPLGGPQQVGLTFWSEDGRPLSAGGQLDELQEISAAPLSRPLRRYGNFRRFRAEVPYLACLNKYFHALRPLRVVIDSSSSPFLSYVKQLCSTVACDLITRSRLSEQDVAIAALARHVKDSEAHFGIWVDGDGELCRIVDQQGHRVESEALLCLLVQFLIDDHPRPAICAPASASEQCVRTLQEIGVQVHESGTSREETYQRLDQCQGLLGLDLQGRVWFRDHQPSVDALKTLALVLNALSQSDRDLSDLADLRQPVQ